MAKGQRRGTNFKTSADQKSHAQAVYMLVDTSGTYAEEIGKAQQIINFLLGALNSGDSLAVARVKLNGVEVDNGKSELTSGPIGFQSEGAEFHIRKIEVKKIK